MDKAERSDDITEEHEYLLPAFKVQAKKTQRLRFAITTVSAIVLLVLPWASYYYGYQVGRSYTPRLPTDAITRDAVEYQRKLLDDEFDVRLAENARFKGPPRPELDDAWESLIRTMHIRVSAERARASNFTSVKLGDGSGDSWGTPVVYHNLHCLKSIRQAQFPQRYPTNWELMKPDKNGGISSHFDHCLDNLRQAIMCQGDMALYHYAWRDTMTLPLLTMKSPHICVNWQRLYDWSVEHSFSLNDGVLIHPKFGKVDPSNWMEEGKTLDEARHRGKPIDG